MQFHAQTIADVWVIEAEPLCDERGYFARTFCEEQFSQRGLVHRFVQSSTAYSKEAGTLRGLHYQRHPHWETKLVRCTRGAAAVVIVDIRDDSPTRLNWLSVDLSQDNHRSVYVPEGCIQGYQTLVDDAELCYSMSCRYEPVSAAGYAFDDPAFGIQWPLAPRNISFKDQSWARFLR